MILGTFRLDYEYEIEYECEFQTGGMSRALTLHVCFRERVAHGMRQDCDLII